MEMELKMIKGIKNAKTSTLCESIKDVDILIKELSEYKDSLKAEIVSRQGDNNLDYATNDGKYTVTLRTVKGSKTLDSKKAKSLLPNWENDCFIMKADSKVLKVNTLKVKA
jgi:hypothetical protein